MVLLLCALFVYDVTCAAVDATSTAAAAATATAAVITGPVLIQLKRCLTLKTGRFFFTHFRVCVRCACLLMLTAKISYTCVHI